MKKNIIFSLCLVFFFVPLIQSMEVEKIDIGKLDSVDEVNAEIDKQKDLLEHAQEEYKRAKYDEATAERARDFVLKELARIDLTDQEKQDRQKALEKWSEMMSADYDRVRRTQAAVDQIKLNIDQLNDRYKQLAGTTHIIAPTREQFLNQYQLDLAKRLDEIKNQEIPPAKKEKALAALIEIEFRGLTEPELEKDYQLERGKLNIINHELGLTHLGQYERREIRNLIDGRIAEIDDFETRKIKPLKDSKIDATLQLSKKIPTDQVQAINKYLEEIIITLNAAGDVKDYATIQQATENLDQLRKVIEYYKKAYGENSEQAKIIQQALDNVNGLIGWTRDQPKLIIPNGINPRDLASDGSFANVLDEKGMFDAVPTDPTLRKSFFSKIRDKVTSFARYPVDKVKTGFIYVLEETGGRLATFGIAMKYLSEATQSVATVPPDAIKNLAENDFVVGGIAALRKLPISTERADNIENWIKFGLKALRGLNEAVGNAAKFSEQIKLGEILNGVSKAAINLAGRLGQAAGTNKVDTILLVDDVLNTVWNERFYIPERKPLFQKIYDKGRDIVKRVLNYVGLIKEVPISEKTKQYEKLQENFNPFSDDSVEQLVKSAQALSQEYEKIAAELSLSIESFAFLVEGWDRVELDKQADIALLVKSFFDLRDRKLAFLQGMKKGIEDIKNVTKDIKDLHGQQLTDYLLSVADQMINSQAIKTIADYNDAINIISNQLEKMKQEFILGS